MVNGTWEGNISLERDRNSITGTRKSPMTTAAVTNNRTETNPSPYVNARTDTGI